MNGNFENQNVIGNNTMGQDGTIQNYYYQNNGASINGTNNKPQQIKMNYASFGKRLCAGLIDAFINTGICLIFMFIALVIGNFLGDEVDSIVSGVILIFLTVIIFGFGGTPLFAYSISQMSGKRHISIGQQIMKIKLIIETKQVPLTSGQLIVRFILNIIISQFLFFDMIVMLITPKKQRIVDLILGSVCIEI